MSKAQERYNLLVQEILDNEEENRFNESELEQLVIDNPDLET